MIAGHGTSDQAPARRLAYGDRATFQRLIDLLVETSIVYLRGQIDAGAEAVQVFDSWASVLPEDEFESWVVAPMVHICAALRHSHPGVPIIGFPRAVGPLYERYIEATGVEGVGCDTSLPLGFIRDKLQPKAVVQGNLDPILLLSGGEHFEARVKRIVATLAGGRHIFNLGHGILPDTPPQHVARLMQLVRGEAD
jgi:uroporphyrinogen decarboxylase